MSAIDLVIEEIVGLGIKEASMITRDHGFIFRITKTDGKPHVVLRDYRKDRINVEIESNEVVHADVG